MSGIIEGAIDEVIHHIDPVPVRIVGTDIERDEAAEYASWTTWFVSGILNEGNQRILPQNAKRKRAVITIRPGGSGNVAGYIVVGSQAGMGNRQGAQYGNGNQITVESSSAVYITGDGAGTPHDFTVSVLDELYDSKDGPS